PISHSGANGYTFVGRLVDRSFERLTSDCKRPIKLAGAPVLFIWI
ncbi:MAG: hypothetical protein QOD87_1664, partial [Pseudonocardiales bacterium]|nr:hypothetical protein [Pseudonocardiales bacterium]